MQACVLWLNDGNFISAGNKIYLSPLQHSLNQQISFLIFSVNLS